MDATKFIERMREFGYKPQPYSGRFMFGKVCVGVPTDDPFTLGVTIGRELERDDTDYFYDAPVRYDTLGLGMIYYWPDLVWPEGMEADDDPDDDLDDDEE